MKVKDYMLSAATVTAFLLGSAGCPKSQSILQIQQIKVNGQVVLEEIVNGELIDTIESNLRSKLQKREFIYDCNDHGTKQKYGDNLNKWIFEQLKEQGIALKDYSGTAKDLVAFVKSKLSERVNIRLFGGFKNDYIIMGPPKDYKEDFHYAVSMEARLDITNFLLFAQQTIKHIEPAFPESSYDPNKLRSLITKYVIFNNKGFDSLEGEHLEIRMKTVIDTLYRVMGNYLKIMDGKPALKKYDPNIYSIQNQRPLPKMQRSPHIKCKRMPYTTGYRA